MAKKSICTAAICCLGFVPPAAAQTPTPAHDLRPPVPPPGSPPGTSPGSPASVSPIANGSEPVESPVGEGKIFGGWLSRINSDAEGWTPRVGSVATGSGIAFGAHGRQALGSRLFADVDMLMSVRGYQSASLGVSTRPIGHRRTTFGVRVHYDGLPREDFYGFGPESQADARVSYHREGVDTEFWATTQLRPWLTFATSAGVLRTQVGAGREPGVPSVEQTFTDSTLPGMSRSTSFGHVGVRLEADRREFTDYTPRGGVYSFEATRYVALGSDEGFMRFEVDARQYLRGLSSADTIALRAHLSATGSSAGQPIPFYFLPRLGSGSTLRGYDTSRFMDRHAAFVTAEYRWRAARKLLIAGFVDAGQVAPSLSAFSPHQFQTAVGAGLRYRLKGDGELRLDYAVGSEGSRWHIGFGPSF